MPLTHTELLLRLGAALVLGGSIGFERELREMPAGLRTHLLVALASATFGLVSLHVAFFQHYPPDAFGRIDHTRIASNIVVGIGFLGGGAILHAGMTIKGLTTAASLWLTAAVGLAAGGGMFVLAASATVLSLFALVVLRYAVEGPRKAVVRLTARVDLRGEPPGRPALADALRPVGAVVTGLDLTRDVVRDRSRLLLDVRLPDSTAEEDLLKRLEGLPGVTRVELKRPESRA